MGDGGFVRLPYELIDSGRLTQNELTVYIALLRHRDHHTGRCWPSHATVAREARVCKSTAKSALKALESKGIVRVVVSEPRKPNVLEVALFNRFPSDSPDGLRDDLGGSGDTPGGSGDDLGVGQEMTDPGSGDDYEQEPITRSIEVDPSNEKHEPALRSADADGTQDFAFDVEPAKPASLKQRTYLKDLYLQIMDEAPPAVVLESWRDLTTTEADERIKAYQRMLPRGEDYQGPEAGDTTYEMLSSNGQDAADRQGLPATVYDRSDAPFPSYLFGGTA